MNIPSPLEHDAGLRLAALGILAPPLACLLSALICRLNGRASAGARHLLWLLAFVMMAVCIPVAVFHLKVTVPILPSAGAGSVSIAATEPPPERPLAAARDTLRPNFTPGANALSTTPLLGGAGRVRYHVPWESLLLGLWMGGFLTLSFAFLAGALIKAALEKKAEPGK